MSTVALPTQLGVCVPFAGGNANKAKNFGLKPRDDSLIGTNTPGPCKIKRVDFNWWTNQGGNYTGPAGRNDDVSGFSNIFQILDNAYAYGYKLIGMCGYTPPWARASGVTTDKDFPGDYRDFANYMYLVARECEARHAGVLVMVECWNEPNQKPFVSVPNHVEYGKMMETCFDASKTGFITGRSDNGTRPVNNVQFMSAGTGAAPSVGNVNRHYNWSKYLIDNHTSKFDHIGIHAYSGDSPLGTKNGWDPGWNDIPQISAALHAKGRDDAQILSTEGGWKVPRVTTVQHAADYLDGTWSWWTARKGTRDGTGIKFGLGPYILFECDDTAPSNIAANDENNQGLYDFGTANGDGISKKVGGSPKFLLKYLALAGTGSTDTTAPTGAITYPAAASTITGTAVDILLGTHDGGTPPGTTPDGLTVNFYRDSVSTALNATPLAYLGEGPGFNFKYTLDSTTLTNGNHTFHFTSTDQAGNTFTSANITYNVQNGGATAPAITSISPNTGPKGTATAVTIIGTDLGTTGTTAVAFGTKPATSVVVTGGTSIACNAPTVTNPKTVDVQVTVGTLTSAKKAADQYVYTDTPPPPGAPTITSIATNPATTPPSGPLAGGTEVIILGSGFTGV